MVNYGGKSDTTFPTVAKLGKNSFQFKHSQIVFMTSHSATSAATPHLSNRTDILSMARSRLSTTSNWSTASTEGAVFIRSAAALRRFKWKTGTEPRGEKPDNQGRGKICKALGNEAAENFTVSDWNPPPYMHVTSNAHAAVALDNDWFNWSCSVATLMMLSHSVADNAKRSTSRSKPSVTAK